MFKKIRLRIVLWALKEQQASELELDKAKQYKSLIFKDMVRNTYIVLTKESRHLQTRIDRLEASLKESHANKLKQAYIDDMESILQEKLALQKQNSKKMFAFLGMFEAYNIAKIKPEELA